MSDPVLTMQGITKAYKKGQAGEVNVLRGADMYIEPGEIVALTAPSGAGKSTLLHIAGLLDRPDDGEILINGENLRGKGDHKRTRARCQQIGFVYQFHYLLPEFTALENVVLPQLVNGNSKALAKERAGDLLEKVGLEGRTHHRPAELSGGEQQRVAICRALSNGPQLLLADEPTGNLDTDTSDQVFDVLYKLVRETDLAALIATHNPDLAKRMDRIIKLEDGRIS